MTAPTPAAMPTRRTTPARPEPEPDVDPALHLRWWNHPCPAPDCTTWVPNHLRRCAHHTEEGR